MGGNQSTVHHGAELGRGDKKWLIRVWIDSEVPFAISSRDSDIQVENQIHWALDEIHTRMKTRKSMGNGLGDLVNVGISIDGDYDGGLGNRLAAEAEIIFRGHNQDREVRVVVTGENRTGHFNPLGPMFNSVTASISALMDELSIRGSVYEKIVRQAENRVMRKADFYTEKV